MDLVAEVNPRLGTEYIMGMEWGISPKSSKGELLAVSGSFNGNAQGEARKLLQDMWYLQPEKSANGENVQSIDMLETFEALPEKQKEFLFHNLTAVEFTRGCNGGCAACFFGDKPRGITHKFQFASIEKFFEKYGEIIDADEAPPNVYPYLNNDLLDYRDGDKTAVDIYTLLKRTCPKMAAKISTAVPTGSQDAFVDLALQIAHEMKTGTVNPTKIEISLWGHNAQRVETCLALVEKKLLDEGLGQRTVDEVMKTIFQLKCRDVKSGKGIQPVGKLLPKQEPMMDIGSPACVDGVVLSPDNTRSIAMIAATPYSPSGNLDIPVTEGRMFAHDSLWAYYRRTDRDSDSDINAIKAAIQYQVTFMQDIVDNTGAVYGDKPDWTAHERMTHLDEVFAGLSRRTVSMQYFIHSFSNICSSRVPADLQNAYYTLARKEWAQMKAEDEETFRRIHELPVTGENAEKADYYTQLHTLFSAKTDLLLDTYKEKGPAKARMTGIVLNHIGVKLADRLPEILADLTQMERNTQSIQAFVDKYWGDRKAEEKEKLSYELTH